MKLKVTQNHIDFGKEGNASSCPIALAFKEMFPDCLDVMVDTSIVINNSLEVRLPAEAKDFISDFDHSEPVMPFEFDIPERENWLDIDRCDDDYDEASD